MKSAKKIDGNKNTYQENEETATETPAETIPKSISRFYDMNNKERGFAVIFNHINFHSEAKKSPVKRTGSQVDCDRLEKCLNGLGFNVIVLIDLTLSELYYQLGEFARKDHSENDCFLLTVLTHGSLGKLHAYDEEYDCTDLWRPFYSSNCPTLKGKPKIFIVQGCQGKLFDHGVTLDSTYNNNNNNNNNNDSFMIDYESLINELYLSTDKPEKYFPYQPLHETDFLVAFSSPPGFFSWRNRAEGAWFIQEFCKQMEQNAYKYHLLELLTFVCCEVATGYQSNVPDDDEYHQKKQAPFICQTLLRICQFTEKKKIKKSFVGKYLKKNSIP